MWAKNFYQEKLSFNHKGHGQNVIDMRELKEYCPHMFFPRNLLKNKLQKTKMIRVFDLRTGGKHWTKN